MLLTGYHGTTLDCAHSIIDEGRFHLSNSNTEWLGEGIYFYFNIIDAYNWNNAAAILHSVVKIEENEYLDIDTEEGAKIYSEMIDYISKMQDRAINAAPTYAQQNQCAVMKILWESCPQIKVVAATFHTERTKVQTLIDCRPKRKEFCVRNNDSIKSIQLILRSDLND